MKMHHPQYANQTLDTQWGKFKADEHGQADIHTDAIDFFEKTLKFKKGAPSKDDSAPLVKETHSDATSHEMPSEEVLEVPAPVEAPTEEGLLDADEETHDEASDEEAPAEDVSKSRFSKKTGKKAGHKK